MCDSCKNILGLNVKKHELHQCPLKKSSYCCFCSSYGHSPRCCTKDLSYREPQILEQLIPVSILEEYGITTNTKLVISPMRTNLPKPKLVIDYIDDPKAIRSLLKAYGNMPKKEDRSKDKYKSHLEKIAKKNNINLVKYIPEVRIDDNYSAKPTENWHGRKGDNYCITEYSDKYNKCIIKRK